MWNSIVVLVDGLTAITGIFLGSIVLIRNPKHLVNKTFFAVSLLASLWAICLLLYEFPLIFNSIFWIKATYLVITVCIIAFFYFSFIFPTVFLKKLWVWAGLFGAAFIGFTIWLLLFTNYWVLNVVTLPDVGLETLWGPGYYYWLLFIWSAVIWICINFILKSQHSSGAQKMQLKYFFFAMGLWGIGVAMPDIIAPLFFNTTRYFSLSPVSAFGFMLPIAYAILKHRLMDIRLVLARTISYALLTLLVVAFYTTGLFLIGNWLLPTQVDGNQLVISAFLALIIAYTIQPLRKFLEQVTENIFFKENYDSDELLNHISKALSSSLNIQKLSEHVFYHLEENIHLEFYSLLLLKENGHTSIDRVIGHDFINGVAKEAMAQLKLIAKGKRQLYIYDELPEKPLKQFMRDKNLGILIHLKTKNDLVGILALGNKKSGDIFTSNDIKVLQILAPQLAIAIQNARQFEEIQQFSEKLKIKIKEATTSLETANQKLKELDKRKDEFLSVAAHELRAPLTAVKGYLSMVLDGDGGSINGKVKDFIQGAVEGAEREVRLVNNMLNVSRIEEGRLVYEMGKVRLRDVARSVFDEFNLDAETKDLHIKLQIPNGIKDSVWVDKDRIHEVVANFVSNAIKYTDKGDISITLLQPAKKTVRLEVADTGYGMSEQEQKKLFSKFFRAESSAGKAMGTGLGLYITKLLVEKFGGKIGFSSEIGKGSVFWFELPLAKKN